MLWSVQHELPADADVAEIKFFDSAPVKKVLNPGRKTFQI